MQSNKCQFLFFSHLSEPVLILKVSALGIKSAMQCPNGLLFGTNNKNIKMNFEPFFLCSLHSKYGIFLSLLKLGRPRFYEKLGIPSYLCVFSGHVGCNEKALRQSFVLVSAYPSIPCGCFVLLDRCVHSTQNFALWTSL